jgi:hypothetical protein
VAIAPTAPVSEPEASATLSPTCSNTFSIPSISAVKTAYIDDTRNTPRSYYVPSSNLIPEGSNLTRGQTLVYMVKINYTPSASLSATYTDYLDKRLTYLDGDHTCTHTPITNLATASGIVTCNYPDPSVLEYQRAFRVKIADDAALGDLYNGALVTSANGTTAWADINHKIVVAPGISATKRAFVDDSRNTTGSYYLDAANEIKKNETVERSQTLVYVIKTTPSATLSATYSDYLDKRLTYVDGDSGCTHTPVTGLATASGIVRCNYGTIPANTGRNGTFRVRIAEDAALGDLFNGALVTASNGSTAWADTNHKIGETPDVSAIKKAYKNEASNTAGNYTLTTEISKVTANEIFVYTIEAKNTTTAVANGVVLVDNLTGENQDKLTYVDGVSACTYESSTKKVRCEGNIPANSTVKFSFRVRTASDLTGPMTIKNVGVVSHAGKDLEIKKDVTVDGDDPTDTPTDAPTQAPTGTVTQQIAEATPTPAALPEAGIFDIPGIAAFAGGLLLVILGILLAL